MQADPLAPYGYSAGTGRSDRDERDGIERHRPTPDRSAIGLTNELQTWIFDEQFIVDRKAIIVCISEKKLGSRAALDPVMRLSHEQWTSRRVRLRNRDFAFGSR